MGAVFSKETVNDGQPRLSIRGKAHADRFIPLMTMFEELMAKPYDPKNHKDGVIVMGVANNSLLATELLQYFNTHLELKAEDLTYGTSIVGSTRLFKALCGLYNGSHWGPPVQPVLPQHIITGPGATSLLDQLGTTLFDDNDSLLIAAPLYNGFFEDMRTRAHVHVRPVRAPGGEEEEYAPSSFSGVTALRGFDQELIKCSRLGSPARAVLLCNPQNPVGRCYDRDAIVAYGKWCEKHNLFLIVDEIYALSVFNTLATPFVSALSIDWAAEGVSPARVVVLTGMSKDFGANGLRIGVLIVQHNDDLIKAMKDTDKLTMIGSASDALWSKMLTDSTFLTWYEAENRVRLQRAYETVCTWCEQHSIPYVPSHAGHFMLVDFSAYLDLTATTDDGRLVTPQEAEQALWTKFIKKGVFVTNGAQYACARAGTFRVTFSLDPDTLREGLARIEAAFAATGAASASVSDS